MTARKIITDKAVLPQTGKTMEEWFAVLDKKNAFDISHKEIFAMTGKIKGLMNLNEWNRNLFTTSYEWHKGIKERGEKGSGIEISVSKTVNVQVSILYDAFANESRRINWLKEKLSIRKLTENKSARVTWSDGKTSLSIDFYDKGAVKSQIVIQHLKIENAERAAELKAFWLQRVAALKAYLEK